jgi:NitT/TauT family transport system permease protein
MARTDTVDADLAGLDALEVSTSATQSVGRKLWAAAWPKLLAVAVVLLGWQALVWSKVKPDYLLPGPGPVFRRLGQDIGSGRTVHAISTTMQRAGVGYALAVAIGGLVGLAVARSRLLRSAIGSLITGLQTMPTIAWFSRSRSCCSS